MNARLVKHLWMGGFGLALGFVISAAGFSDWGEIHRMFSFGFAAGGPTLANLRLVLAFSGAMVVAFAGFRLLARRDKIPVKPIRKGTVAGAVLFGAGWAISGGCPGAVLVQLGEGKVLALVTLVGVLAGMWLHEQARRAFHWPRHSCVD